MSEDDAQKTEKIDVASEEATEDGVAAVTAPTDAPEQAEPTVQVEVPAEPTVQVEVPAEPTVNVEVPAEPTVKAEVPAEPTVVFGVPAEAEGADIPASGIKANGEKSTNWLVVGGAFAAGVVLVGTAAAAVVFGMQSHDRGNELSYRDSATQSACDFGNMVSTWDPAKFDDWISKVKAQSTGAWLDQFSSGAEPLKELMQQAGVKSSVAEIHCGWQAGDADHATVVMLISQQEQRSIDPTPQISDVDVVATMEHKDGNWLVSDFKSPRLANMLKSTQLGGAPNAGAPAGAAPAPAPAPPK